MYKTLNKIYSTLVLFTLLSFLGSYFLLLKTLGIFLGFLFVLIHIGLFILISKFLRSATPLSPANSLNIVKVIVVISSICAPLLYILYYYYNIKGIIGLISYLIFLVLVRSLSKSGKLIEFYKESIHWVPLNLIFPKEPLSITEKEDQLFLHEYTFQSIQLRSYSLEFALSYEVDGVTYSHDRYSYTWSAPYEMPNQELDYAKNLAGQTLELMYNPNNPQSIQRYLTKEYLQGAISLLTEDSKKSIQKIVPILVILLLIIIFV